jgi:hypothetical protein
MSNTLNRNLDGYSTTVVLTDFGGDALRFNESQNLFAIKLKPYDHDDTSVHDDVHKYLNFTVNIETKNLSKSAV